MNRAEWLAELDGVEATDLAWFRSHPDADERMRPVTVAEQLGWFLGNGGQVIGQQIRIVRHDYRDRQGNLVRSVIRCPEL